jgi:preprotein translocase subunit YajC
MAEMFLMAWAILATVLAVFFHMLVKRAVANHKAVSFLLAEVATGDVKVKEVGDGFLSVENEDLRMTFKRVGD